MTAGYIDGMAMNEEDLERREEAAAAREAAGIGGRKPEYENEEGDPVGEAERVVIEGGEGVEEGFETAESDLREAATHGEHRYDPSAHDFGDEESAGDADAVSGEADQVEVPDGPEDGPNDEH